MRRARHRQGHQPCRLAAASGRHRCGGELRRRAAGQPPGLHRRASMPTAPAALFAACEQAGVRRVVQVSAIGVDRGAATAFARTKLAGDEALMARNLDWVILRPSVVVGRQAYGGSALFRGLAALPIMPRVAGAGPLQVVQLDDLVRTVLFFLQPGAPSRIALEIVGPERLSLEEVLVAYRRWLGHGDARFVTRAALAGARRVSAGRSHRPARLAAAAALHRAARADAWRRRRPAPWTRLTGIEPRSLRRCAGGGARLGAGAMVCAALLRQAADPWRCWRSIGSSRAWWRWALAGRTPWGSSRRRGSRQPPRWRPRAPSPTLRLASPSPSGAPPDPRSGLPWRCRLPTWHSPRCCCRGYGPTRSGPWLKVLPIMVLNLVALAILDDR